MLILKQSTAVDVLIGPFVDKTDGVTAEVGESPTVKLSKNGQALAAKNDITTPVHDADGYYNCELDATDTNTVGTLVLSVAASANAAPVRHEFQVIEEAIYDSLYGASAAGFDASGNVSADLIASQSNSVTFPALTVTGQLTVSDGIVATCSTVNKAAMSLTGNGTGNGLIATGGTGASGIKAASGSSSNQHGLELVGDGTGEGLNALGGASGHGIQGQGGGGNVSGIVGIGTGTGHGMNLTAAAGTGDGLHAQGGTGGDGIAAVLGAGGVDIRGDITGDITGTIDTCTTNTDMRGTDNAATATALATVDANVDAILVDTGTTIPAILGTPAADIAADIAVVDSNVDGVKAVTDALTAAAATKLAASMLGVITGTATGGSTSSVTSGLTGEGDDTFNGRLMVMTSGTMRYEAGIITDYDSATGTFTFAASTWTTTPTSETFIIL